MANVNDIGQRVQDLIKEIEQKIANQSQGDGGKLKAKQTEMLEARRAGRTFKKAKCKKGLLENAERGIK